MVAIALPTINSNGSLGKLAPFSQAMSGPVSGLQPSGSLRTKISKLEVAEAFLTNLRARGSIDVDQPGFIDSIKGHFDSLPSR